MSDRVVLWQAERMPGQRHDDRGHRRDDWKSRIRPAAVLRATQRPGGGSCDRPTAWATRPGGCGGSGIRADRDGVTIVTLFLSRRIPWRDVDHFAVLPLGRSPNVGHVVLRDGSKFGTFGLSTSARNTEREPPSDSAFSRCAESSSRGAPRARSAIGMIESELCPAGNSDAPRCDAAWCGAIYLWRDSCSSCSMPPAGGAHRRPCLDTGGCRRATRVGLSGRSAPSRRSSLSCARQARACMARGSGLWS